MKIFIVILALVAVVATDHHEGHDNHEGHTNYVVKTQSDLASYRQKCLSKLNVPAEHIEKFKKWEFPDDEITRCYMKCIFEEFGFFDETNGFDVHKIHHQLEGGVESQVDHTNETHGKIESCADKNTQGSDACTWAYRGGMCFIREHLQLVKHSVETH